MFTRHVRYIFLILFLAPAASDAQTGRVSGRIADAQNNPVGYATVTLLHTDGKVASGDLTRENGSFSIGSTGLGRFRLRINAMGFEEKLVDGITLTAASPETDLGRITLTVSEKHLKGVDIVSEKPVMELSVDKKTFNVDKNITATGGSAADVLQNVPSVSVDNDGNVSLRGKSNITLLIDGKPATLLGGDAASALQSLPAGSVQSVEVITNPSARYDAQGMGGIVNIVTKRDKKFGMNGNVAAGVGTREKYNGSIGLNFRNKKWNLFLNSNARWNRNYNRITTGRSNVHNDTTYHTYEDFRRKHLGWFTTAGAEFAIDERNTVTLTENVNIMQFGGAGTTDYSIYDGGTKISHQYRENNTSVRPLSFSTTLDYRHKFRKPKQELTLNATYARMEATRQQEYITRQYDGQEVLTLGPVVQNGPGTGGNSNFTGQADITLPFLTKNGKLDAGLKTQLFWFETSNNPTVTQPGQPPVQDITLLSSYNYNQNIHAAYTSYTDQFGKFGVMGGLRLEYATYEGTTNAFNGQKYTNEFLNLFPSVFLSYQLPGQQSMYLNYTRRINRPWFMQLMPYVDLSNPQDTSMGNPDLIPEFINNTELSYSRQFRKGHQFIAGIYYQYTENLIERYRLFYENGTTFTQPRNLSSGQTYGLELTGRAQLHPVWDAMLNVNLFENRVNGVNVDPALNNSGFGWFAKMNTNVKMPFGFSLQLNANYESPKAAAQSTQSESWWIDAALKKSLWKNTASIVLNVSDIFDTHKYTSVYDLPLYHQTAYRDRETRIGNLTFTWRFGKSSDPRGGRRRQGNGMMQEKDRNNLKTDDADTGGGF